MLGLQLPRADGRACVGGSGAGGQPSRQAHLTRRPEALLPLRSSQPTCPRGADEAVPLASDRSMSIAGKTLWLLGQQVKSKQVALKGIMPVVAQGGWRMRRDSAVLALIVGVALGVAACGDGSTSAGPEEIEEIDEGAETGGSAGTAAADVPNAARPEANSSDDDDGSAEWLYIVNEDEGDHGLFAVRSDGGHQRKLTDFDAYPVLSPTGLRIAYLVRGSDGGAALFVADVDGTNQKKLADLDDDVGPVWSPDETRLAFSDYREDDYGDGDFEVFVVAVDGTSSPQQITRNSTSDDIIGPMYGSWSPDSARIAFSRDYGASYTEDRPDNYTKVFVMDTDGSDERQLVAGDDSQDFAPVWSPDGTRVAYFSDRDDVIAISVIDAGGSEARELVADYQGSAGWSPAWSPDSSRIAFYDRRDNALVLSVVNADGSGLRPLVKPLTVADYLRSPPVWSPDGTRIAFSDGRDGDNEVFVIDADGSNLRQLTHNDSHDHAISWQ